MTPCLGAFSGRVASESRVVRDNGTGGGLRLSREATRPDPFWLGLLGWDGATVPGLRDSCRFEAEAAPDDIDLPTHSLAMEAAEQVACWLRDGVTARDALVAMGRYPGGGWPRVFAAVMREISRMRVKENA